MTLFIEPPAIQTVQTSVQILHQARESLQVGEDEDSLDPINLSSLWLVPNAACLPYFEAERGKALEQRHHMMMLLKVVRTAARFET